ncbi:MAG TPA: Ig-like domain-containing protein [Chryseosolibacter sp.]
MKYIIPLLITLLFLIGCARQTSPTGGPKDTIPPKLVSSSPINEQTNFSSKTVTLDFTEQVNLNSAKEQVIITPSIGKDYEITAKKKTVVIHINTELDPNTTYNINFRDAVQDITEKNPVRDLKLAFSTGEYIDSLTITGKVVDLITNKEIKDATVALQHTWADTMSIMKHPSFYFTKTNDKGEFKIDYVKPGIYQLYAYQDKNKNLIVDPRNEGYAFIAKPLDFQNDTSKILLKIIHLDTRQLKLTSARPYNTYFNLKTTKNIRDYKITSTEDISSWYGEDRSNIRVYNTFKSLDSLQIRLTATDSSGSSLDTTLYAKFRQDPDIDPDKFTMSLTETSITARTGQIKIKYIFNKPVSSFNLDSIYYKKDTLTTIRFNSQDVNWDPLANAFTITKTVDKNIFLIPETDPSAAPSKKQDTTTQIKPINELHTRKGAFISVEGDTSASLKQTLKPSQPSELSEIFYDVRSKKKNILIQLLTKDFKLIRQTNNSLKGSFSDLPAGDYIIRYVVDTNNNGQLDFGNYLDKKEPEPVYYSTDPKGSLPQTLKANWELELAPMLISD